MNKNIQVDASNLQKCLNKIKKESIDNQIDFLNNLNNDLIHYQCIFNYYNICPDECKQIIIDKMKQILLGESIGRSFKTLLKNIDRFKLPLEAFIKDMTNEELLLLKPSKKINVIRRYNYSFVKLIVLTILEKNNDNDLLLYWYKNNKFDFGGYNAILRNFTQSFIDKGKKSSFLIAKDLLDFIYNFAYQDNPHIRKIKRIQDINNIYDSITFDVFIEFDKYFKIYKNNLDYFYTVFQTFIKHIKVNETIYDKYFNQLENLLRKKKVNAYVISNKDFSFLDENYQKRIKSIYLLRKLEEK